MGEGGIFGITDAYRKNRAAWGLKFQGPTHSQPLQLCRMRQVFSCVVFFFSFPIGENDCFLMIMTMICFFDSSGNEKVAHSRSHKNSCFFPFFPPSFISPSKVVQ